MIGPDKKIKLVLIYPMTTGRNFDEVLRVIDSLQLTAKHKVATPVNWKQGEDVIIAGSVSNDEAQETVPGRLGVPAAVHPDRAAAQLSRGRALSAYAPASCTASSAAIDARQNRCSRQIDRASALWAAIAVRRVRRAVRRSAGFARRRAGSARAPVASDAHATDGRTSSPAISATRAASVASMTAAISRFIGRAAVVTRR